MKKIEKNKKQSNNINISKGGIISQNFMNTPLMQKKIDEHNEIFGEVVQKGTVIQKQGGGGGGERPKKKQKVEPSISNPDGEIVNPQHIPQPINPAILSILFQQPPPQPFVFNPPQEQQPFVFNPPQEQQPFVFNPPQEEVEHDVDIPLVQHGEEIQEPIEEEQEPSKEEQLATLRDELMITDESEEEDKKKLDNRLDKWKNRIGNRENKTSNAEQKRSKMFYDLFATADDINPDDISNGVFLWTHTAPIVKPDDSSKQGKDFRAGSNTDYFRTSQKNKQADFLKVNGKKLYIADKNVFEMFLEQNETFASKINTVTIGNIILAVTTASTRANYVGLSGELNSHSKLKIANELSKIKKNQTQEVDDENDSVLGVKKSVLKNAITTLGLFTGNDFKYAGQKAVTKDDIINVDGNEATEGANKYIKDDATAEQIKNYVTGAIDIGELETNNNYIEEVLTHCRKVVDSFPSFSKLKIVKTKIRGDGDSANVDGYYLYPALIIEPIVVTPLTATTIKPHIDFIMKDFNSRSKIKIYLRNSFGFLYPTISDLERSIRIWPGQIDPEDFRSKMVSTLYFYNKYITDNSTHTGQDDDIEGVSDIKDTLVEDTSGYTMLFKSLDKTLIFIKNIYERDEGFKDDKKTKFLHNRVVPNIEKANLLKQEKEKGFDELFKDKDNQDIFLEVTQVIENLNEYGFELIKQLNKKVSAEEFTQVINNSYANKAPVGFKLTKAQVTQSGMQAGAIAMSMPKKSNFELGPGYFEFAHIGKFLDNGTDTKTLHYDPAYNFTSEDDTNEDEYKNFIKDNKNVAYDNVVMDITNVKPSEINSILTKHNSAGNIYLYGSLSKHFQMGMDKFTLGILLQYTKQEDNVIDNLPEISNIYMPNELIQYFVLMQKTHLPLP